MGYHRRGRGKGLVIGEQGWKGLKRGLKGLGTVCTGFSLLRKGFCKKPVCAVYACLWNLTGYVIAFKVYTVYFLIKQTERVRRGRRYKFYPIFLIYKKWV